MANITLTRNALNTVVLAAMGTGPSSITFNKFYVQAGDNGVFQFSMANVVGSFSGLTINLEFTPQINSPYWETVGTWSPLTTPIGYFTCSEAGFYRLNITTFTGGTQFDVFAGIALPSGSTSGGGGGGGGSVTQGTVPWVVAGAVNGTSATNASWAVWTSSTGANTAATVQPVTSTATYNTIVVEVLVTPTQSGAGIYFQVSNDNTNWQQANGVQYFGGEGTLPAFFNGFLTVGSTTILQFNVSGFQYFRALLFDPFTGNGTLTLSYAMVSNGDAPLTLAQLVGSSGIVGQVEILDSFGGEIQFLEVSHGNSIPSYDAATGIVGASPTGYATQVGGTDGTTLRAISTDSSGHQNINNLVSVSGTATLQSGKTISEGSPASSVTAACVDIASVGGTAIVNDGNLPVIPGTPTQSNAGWSHAIINISSASGNQTLIPAVTGHYLIVMAFAFTVTAATNVFFTDGTATLSGTYTLNSSGSSLSGGLNGQPLWQTAAVSRAIELNLSGTASVGGDVWYVVV